MKTMKALLAMEDGRTFSCRSFTGSGEACGEIVFNTSMTGYQEILTDPSYKGQMVTMTYPLIGNYGVNGQDVESDRVQASALLIKEYQSFPSNYRSTQTLADYLEKQKILGIEELDTRAITRHIRNTGAMRAFVSTEDLDPSSLVRRANEIPPMEGQDLAKTVTTEVPFYWKNGRPEFFDSKTSILNKDVFKYRKEKKSVVAFDFGIKYNILRCLEATGFEVVVVPSSTTADTIKEMSPDGIFLSNGPGDPEPVTDAIETIGSLLGYSPIFGICLGNQLLGLALGGTTFKLKFGHRGGNQPVKNLLSGRIEITSQNHGFAVDLDTLKRNDIEITHINLNDNTLEGFRHLKYPAFAVQYHPEASPGPHDAGYLFDEFKKMMNG